MEYTITRRLNSTLDELSSEFQTPYCDRDFRHALRKLKASDEGNRPSNLSTLLRMLKKCGFSYRPAKPMDNEFYEKLVMRLIQEGTIPTSDELSDSIFSSCEKLFERYRAYPSPADYMKRLVNRCCSAEDPWQNDSLRMRILKQFIKYGNYLAAGEICKKKYIKEYVARRLGKEEVTDEEVLNHLDDHVFAMIVSPTAEEIETGMHDAAARLEAPGQRLHALMLDAENAALPASFDAQDYQAAADLVLQEETLAYLTGCILRRHAAETLGNENLTVEEARAALGESTWDILSALIAQSVSRALLQSQHRNSIIKSAAYMLSQNKATAKGLAEHLCSQIRKTIHDQNNDEDYHLLQIAGSLASGQFIIGGATKHHLYLFAIVFGMTYYCKSHAGSMFDAARDVEKNLFTDYYADNVVQYLSPAALGGKSGSEVIPSGYSINYKNYAEVIFLYFISREEEDLLTEKQRKKLTENEKQVRLAEEKLKRAVKMIKAVKVLDRDMEQVQTPDLQDGATLKMKARVWGSSSTIASEDIMALSEEDFQNFIIENYDRRVYIGNTSRSPFQVNAESQTALAEYTRIVNKLLGSAEEEDESSPFDDYLVSVLGLKANLRDKDYDDVANRNLQKEFSYGLAFDEAHWAPKENPNASKPTKKAQADAENTADQLMWVPEGKPRNIDWSFYQMLRSVDTLLRDWLEYPQKINRTKLLAALYYEFNERHTEDVDEIRGHSFQEHYALFRKEINPVLEDCNYALLSGKSLLDVLIVFSSYIYLNA